MSDSSTAMLMVRMGVSLAIILGMIWMAARFVRRRGRLLSRSSTEVEVVARRSTGRRSNLLVVRVGGRTLLVGATDNQVSLVADVTGSVETEVVDAPIVAASMPLSPIAAAPSSVDLRQPSRPIEAAGVRRTPLLDSIRDLTVRKA